MFRQLTPLLLLAASATAQDHRPPVDPISPHVRGPWEAFVSAADGNLMPRFETGTGFLSAARGRLRVAASVDRQNAAQTGRQVLRQLAPVLGMSADDLRVRGVADARSGVFHVVFGQEVDGVPVEGAAVGLRLSAAGDLHSVRSAGLLRGLVIDTVPAVSREDAGELARVSVPGSSQAADAWQPTLMIVPDDGGRLVWRVGVSDPTLEIPDWYALIDATTGVTLRVGEAMAGSDVKGKAEGFGTPSGTMEANPEAKMALSRLRIRASDWSSEIFKMSSDGGSQEALISPDGSRVFWTSSEDGDREIWTALIDGSGSTRLTDNGADEYDLSTDYAGTAVFFTSEATGDPELFVVDADGTGLTQLTFDAGIDRGVSVTRDGLSMVWESDRDGDFEIYTGSTAGGAATQLTSNSLHDAGARIAGDGGRIGFLSGSSPTDAMVWVMDADGSSPAQLVFGGGFCDDLSITNDGGVVFFERWQPSAGAFGGSSGGLFGAGRGRATYSPRVWAASTDGLNLEALSNDTDAYQVDPWVAGENAAVAFAQRTDAGDLDIVHMELFTRSTVRYPAPVDQVGPSLADDGLLGAFVDENTFLIDLRPGMGSYDTFTEVDGSYAASFAAGASVTLEAGLEGLHVRVEDQSAQKNLREVESATAPETGVDLLFNDPGTHALKTPQVTGYAQHALVHDFLELSYSGLGYPSPYPFDGQLPVRVNYRWTKRNAYYSFLKNETRYCVGSGVSAPGTCFDTVVWHEYGHYVDEQFGRALTLGGMTRPGHPLEHSWACSEAIGDWVSMLASGTSVIGAGWKGGGTWIRNYDKRIKAKGSSDRQWDCLDCKQRSDFYNAGGLRWEEHQHGEALAGFGKDLRSYSSAVIAKQILLDTIALHPADMADAVDTAFLVDLVFNGGANFPALCKAARRHGFDCPPAPDWASHGCVFLDWCGPIDAHHIDSGPESLGYVTDSEPFCEFPDGDEDGLIMPADTFFSGETIDVDLILSVESALLKSGRYGGKIKATGAKNPLRYLYVNAWILVDEGGELSVDKILGTGSGAAGNGPFGGDTFAVDPDSEWGGAAVGFYDVDFKLPDVSVPSAAIIRLRLDYGEDGGRPDLKALNPLNSGGYFGDCGASRSGEVEDYQVLLVPEG